MKTHNKPIELEFRAEVPLSSFKKILAQLEKRGETISQTKRLSVMFLGKVGAEQFDVRVRIDDGGKAEIVFKRGAFHSHDRREESQNVSKGQIVGLVKGLSLLGFSSKVTERHNFDFLFPKRISVTLVRSKNICYVEFEKKTTEESFEQDKRDVLETMGAFNLEPLTADKFDDLCERLSLHCDWTFHDSEKELKKIRSLLTKY